MYLHFFMIEVEIFKILFLFSVNLYVDIFKKWVTDNCTTYLYGQDKYEENQLISIYVI